MSKRVSIIPYPAVRRPMPPRSALSPIHISVDYHYQTYLPIILQPPPKSSAIYLVCSLLARGGVILTLALKGTTVWENVSMNHKEVWEDENTYPRNRSRPSFSRRPQSRGPGTAEGAGSLTSEANVRCSKTSPRRPLFASVDLMSPQGRSPSVAFVVPYSTGRQVGA